MNQIDLLNFFLLIKLHYFCLVFWNWILGPYVNLNRLIDFEKKLFFLSEFYKMGRLNKITLVRKSFINFFGGLSFMNFK